MQFYLVVPTLFFLLNLVKNLRSSIKFVILSLIPLLSLAYQLYAVGDAAYMLLPARLWQFFVGFAAHYAYEMQLLNFAVEGKKDARSCSAIFDGLFDFLTGTLLLSSFIYGLDAYPQANRLIVLALTGLIVGRHAEQSALFNLRWIIVLGDVSYSVYLVHWPLFTWHRYANMSDYSDDREASFCTGSTLILISILLGFAIEKLFKFLLKPIDRWTFLLVVLVAGYSLNGHLLYKLQSRGIDLDDTEAKRVIPDAAKIKIRDDMRMLWNQRDQQLNYTNGEISAINSEMTRNFRGVNFCDNTDLALPTRYPINLTNYGDDVYVCRTKGNGTKNIVVIGNSHAFFNFPGIQYQFRDTYKRLTLFSKWACFPTARQFQKTAITDAERDICARLVNETITLLQQWQQPIDIIITYYALIDRPEIPLVEPFEKDEFLNVMQDFYTRLEKIPRVALMVMESYARFPEMPIREVESRMQMGKPMKGIGAVKKALLRAWPTLRRRSELVRCGDKCIKFRLLDFWCDKGKVATAFCHSASDQGIIYFLDHNHSSPFGSYFAGNHIYELYQDFLKKRRKKA